MSARTVMRAMSRLGWAGLAVGAATVAIGPLLWAVSTSLKIENAIFSVPPRLVPDPFTVRHYVRLIEEGIGVNVVNSAINTLAAVVLALALGTLAGYAFARFNFPAKRALLLLFLGSMAVPSYCLLLPIQLLFFRIGLFDTPAALIVLYTAHVVPFVIWITRAHFHAVPRELEFAAYVDGYSRWATLWRVVLPGARPALIAGGTFALLYAWNDYITATTMIYAPGNRTLPVALIFFQGFHGRDWGALMAGIVVATLPPLAAFLAFRRYLIGGFSSGAVKG
jgi:multiple sugar transport system permease protein